MEPKHSGLGIIAFVLSIVALVGAFGLLAIAAVLSLARHAPPDARHMGQVLFLMCLIALVLANLLALGLGIAGLMQPQRKKVFAVLGTAFAGLQVAIVLLLVVIRAVD